MPTAAPKLRLTDPLGWRRAFVVTANCVLLACPARAAGEMLALTLGLGRWSLSHALTLGALAAGYPAVSRWAYRRVTGPAAWGPRHARAFWWLYVGGWAVLSGLVWLADREAGPFAPSRAQDGAQLAACLVPFVGIAALERVRPGWLRPGPARAGAGAPAT